MADVHTSSNHPIIIIDQSDTVFTYPWPTYITYIHVPGRGLSLARNRAVQHCTTPYILFTDDDCRPTHDWIIQAHKCITTDPNVAAWFGQAWPSGTEYTLHHYQTHTGHITWATRYDGASCHALRIDNQPFHTHQPVAVLEHLGHGNQMLIHCATLKSIGGFNPWLGAGAWLQSGEDVDMALCMLSHGHACAFAPSLRIIHDAWIMPVEHARLIQRYSTGMIALHLYHAWQGMQIAYDYLHFRYKEATNSLYTAPRTVSSIPPVPRWRYLIAMLHGIIGGIGLILWRRSK